METLIVIAVIIYIVYRMFGSKQKKKQIPAKQLSSLLMIYTITGSLDTDNPDNETKFSIGPQLWSREPYAFKKEMETCFFERICICVSF